MTKRKTRRGSPLHITPSFELFSNSKQLVLDNRWVFGPLLAIQLLFIINTWLTNHSTLHGGGRWRYDLTNHSGGWLSTGLPNYSWGLFLSLSLTAIIMIVISVVTQILLQQAQLDSAEGKSPHFGRLWQTAEELGWRMVGLYILITLYVLVGLILLIIPGLIMLRRYYLAPYVLLDKKCGIKEAMEESARISKPYSGYIWGVIGVMFLISLLNVIPLIGGLAAFIVGSLYTVAPALRYQELKKIHA
ncbi:MAG TPA: hypothetical protein VFP35_03460 [Candidatus Saccharimonadales bacterium]|nr:hypothetical protein [Candidatus Saccharimonadales bacterium]